MLSTEFASMWPQGLLLGSNCFAITFQLYFELNLYALALMLVAKISYAMKQQWFVVVPGLLLASLFPVR